MKKFLFIGLFLFDIANAFDCTNIQSEQNRINQMRNDAIPQVQNRVNNLAVTLFNFRMSGTTDPQAAVDAYVNEPLRAANIQQENLDRMVAACNSDMEAERKQLANQKAQQEIENSNKLQTRLLTDTIILAGSSNPKQWQLIMDSLKDKTREEQLQIMDNVILQLKNNVHP